MFDSAYSPEAILDEAALAPSDSSCAGQSFSYTFDQPGEFDYACTPHPWMKGHISVMMH